MLRSNVQQVKSGTTLGGPMSTSPTCNAAIVSGFIAPVIVSFSIGMNIAQIAAQEYTNSVGVIAEIFNGNDWEVIPPEMWKMVFPQLSNIVRFAHPLAGGKNGGQVFALIATIALTAIAGPAGGLGLGASLGAAVGISAAAGTAAVNMAIAVGVAYAGSKLFPPTVADFTTKQEQDASNFENVKSGGNPLPIGGYLQWVAGERRVTLPELAQPFSYLKDGVDTVDRIFGWKGHHTVKDIEVNDTPIDDFELVQTQITDGSLSTPVETFINKHTNTVQISQQFGQWALDDSELEDQIAPRNSEPQALQFASSYRNNLEEIAIRMQLGSFSTRSNETQKIALPVRLWFRPKGTTDWNGICELHIVGLDVGKLLKDIRLRWDGDFDDGEDQEDISGVLQYRVFSKVPSTTDVLSDGSTGTQFEAHDYFKSGEGVLQSANIRARRSGLRITLDEDVFKKQAYEFKFETGLITDDEQVTDNYEVDGKICSLFRSFKEGDIWKVPVSQKGYPAQISLSVVSSIIAEQPVQKPGTGVLAMRTTRNVGRVTAVLGSMVNRYDGENFADLGTSSNPADYLFALYDKATRFWNVSNKVIREDTLSDLHKECAARDYRCSIIFNGQSFAQMRDSIASAGFARAIYDGGLGVDYFRDRSNEIPMHTFSPKSAHEISYNVKRIKRPESFRVTFPNRANGWEMSELNVLSDFPSTIKKQLAMTFNNVDRKIDVLRRLHFDDYSTQYQNTEVNIAGFKDAHELRVGSLIGVATDLIGDYTHGFRIRDVLGPTRIQVDAEIPSEIVNDIYTAGNLFDIENMFNLGTKTAIYFNAYDPLNDPKGERFYMDSRIITNVDGDVLTLDSPITEIDLGDGNGPYSQAPKVGSHVTVTPESNSRFRYIVVKNERGPFGEADLTAVPDDPRIIAKMLELN